MFYIERENLYTLLVNVSMYNCKTVREQKYNVNLPNLQPFFPPKTTQATKGIIIILKIIVGETNHHQLSKP